MSCYLNYLCNNNSCHYEENNCKNCPIYFRLNKLFDYSLLSNKQRQYYKLLYAKDIYGNVTDKNAYDKLNNIKDNIVQSVKNGSNFYIYSSTTGNGKTTWAIKLIQYYLGSIYNKSDFKCRALFISIPRYLSCLKSEIGQQKSDYVKYVEKNIRTADIIVWDDIAIKSMSEWEQEKLLDFINYRIDFGLSNVYTANVLPDRLEQLLGARLSSRIRGSYLIEFKSPDLRGKFIR